MQILLVKLSKVINLIITTIYKKKSNLHTKIIFYINGIKYKSITSNGTPFIHKSLKSTFVIDENFTMNNGLKFSNSGINGKCRIEVRENAALNIGANVGLSDVTITCHEKISIGNNVMIGVGTQIRDTDNHSLNPYDWGTERDWHNKKTAFIKIEDNVFIGSNCIILKGVNIGNNSIVGAGSVVTKDIPCYQIWAGNPAKFVKTNKREE